VCIDDSLSDRCVDEYYSFPPPSPPLTTRAHHIENDDALSLCATGEAALTVTYGTGCTTDDGPFLSLICIEQCATCTLCAVGYYLNDGVCIQCTCDPAGVVTDVCDNEGVCSCAYGHAGAACEYSQENTCNGNGTPDGNGVCSCDSNFDPDTQCQQCVDHWKLSDDDDDGVCIPACTPSVECNNNGLCDDLTDECICGSAFDGAACNVCAANHYAYPACVECVDETNCSGAGTCTETTSSFSCTCEDRYTGDSCDACSSGSYRDGGNSCITCPTDHRTVDGLDASISIECTAHGTCDPTATTAAAACTCDSGFTGIDCNEITTAAVVISDGVLATITDVATTGLHLLDVSVKDSWVERELDPLSAYRMTLGGVECFTDANKADRPVTALQTWGSPIMPPGTYTWSVTRILCVCVCVCV
jgi:hypothetical protein